jgi:ankyrin repeat protein
VPVLPLHSAPPLRSPRNRAYNFRWTIIRHGGSPPSDEELHDALRHGEPLEVIQEIVRSDPASIRRKDGNGSLPLHVAARHGALVGGVVRFLADRCPQALEEKQEQGWLPLHVAVRLEASFDVVRLLVNRCPHALEEKDKEGGLPLHGAVCLGASFPVVQLLVDRCPVALRDKALNGLLPLLIALGSDASLPVV